MIILFSERPDHKFRLLLPVQETPIHSPEIDESFVRRLALLTGDFTQAGLLLSNGAPGAETELLAGFGARQLLSFEQPGHCFEALQNFQPGKLLLGHFSYDLKNETEALASSHPDGVGFPVMTFFEPEHLVRKNKDQALQLSHDLPQPSTPFQKTAAVASLRQRTPKSDYLRIVKRLLQHIHRGDIYEINYCIEFFAENISLDPRELFLRLNRIARAPFSALYRNGDRWLICASPERFLLKKGKCILSQPIKGTRPRGKSPEEDAALAIALRNDPKEQSENVMIVDLVRNDLSRIAARGSVHVDELFGIYSFPTVHQMISTVSAELKEGISPVEAIRASFPMGSMTGAPKVRAMQLAEEYEQMRRGLYSGAVGYFTPEGDFDFNVVIRSIQYNAATGYLSFMVGSAITANADPEKEYEECLLKAGALLKALGTEWI